MNRPALIPHHLKEHFHSKHSCIDIRGKKAHAIKANTNNRSWHNVITSECAAIAINYRTKHANTVVQTSKDPIHVLSFGCGADTFYWGRYRFSSMKTFQGQECFVLKFVDDGDLHMCLPKDTQQTRSRLEKQWLDAFDVSGTEHVYEPATLHLPSSKLLPDKEYTPDIWLPASHEFIEIKGPKPSKVELEKCRLTTQLGFKIKMFRGAPDGFDCYDWDSNGKYTKSHHSSWYRYEHPHGARKRRRVHNVT
jgi:hypothetical protein